MVTDFVRPDEVSSKAGVGLLFRWWASAVAEHLQTLESVSVRAFAADATLTTLSRRTSAKIFGRRFRLAFGLLFEPWKWRACVLPIAC